MADRLNPDVVRGIIFRALELLDPEIPHTPEAAQQLLMTVAAETGGWDHVVQIGGGPAVSWWQIEPATIDDTQRNWLDHREAVNAIVWRQVDPMSDLVEACRDDPCVAAMLARIRYRRAPDPFVSVGDLEGQARLWKRVYNTEDGKGTPEHALENYRGWVER